MRHLMPFLLLFPLLASAQEEPGLMDLQQARSIGMGGAYRAAGLGAEAINGNPASMSMFKRYVVELGGAWDAQTRFGYATAAVLDSATTAVAAGLSYHFISLGRGEGSQTGHQATLALSAPLSDRLMVGAAGRYLTLEGSGMTMDAGLAVRLGDAFFLGVSGHNLLDHPSRHVHRQFAASFGYAALPLVFVGDVRAEFVGNAPQMAYNVGAEYTAGNTVPLRLGYAYDTFRNNQSVSAGIGVTGTTGGVDLAYRHEIGGRQSKLIGLTIRLLLQ